jgi:SOS-response transcriptional repressor LexA
MKQSSLSSRQQAVYDFIGQYHIEQGIAPSFRDIADSLQISLTAVRTYIEILKTKGYIAQKEGIRRSLRILKTKAVREAE